MEKKIFKIHYEITIYDESVGDRYKTVLALHKKDAKKKFEKYISKEYKDVTKIDLKINHIEVFKAEIR